MHSFYLDAIKSFEGYTPSAQWDYAQLSNGYGTKAKFAGEKIDKTEADRRFQAEVSSARSIVEKNAPFVDEGTKAALTSLTYNAGDSWTRSGLGDAVRRGDLEQVRDIFQQYNKAGGEVLPGLVSRRAAEALWIGNPDAVSSSSNALASLTSGQSSTAAAQPQLPPVVMAAADTARADSRPVASLPQSLVRLPTKSESRETVSSDALASLRRLTGHEMLALTALENATGAASPSLAAPSDVSRMMKLDNAHASIASRDDERRNGGQRSA
jgi:lysozyme